jgi:hypothetical protein
MQEEEEHALRRRPPSPHTESIVYASRQGFGGTSKYVALGLGLPRLHGCTGADGLAADGDGRPQLADARMIIDAVRNDPAWKGGDYSEQPQAFRLMNVYCGIVSIGGTLAYQKQAPTRELADKLLEQRIAAATKVDANDFLYFWDSSRDYNVIEGGQIAEAGLAGDTADG